MESEHYEFDTRGRMKYHPDFHFSHGQPFSQGDLEYLCKFHEHDGLQSVAFALGKTEGVCEKKIYELKKSGMYEHYKSLNLFYAGRDKRERSNDQ